MIIRDNDYIRLNYISDFIEDFVAPIHRERLYFLLSKPNRREEVIRHFYSDEYFDTRYLHSVTKDKQNADAIYDWMRQQGATSECLGICREPTLNGIVDLKNALKECFNTHGSPLVLYCRKSKIGYYEYYENDPCRWFLRKTKGTTP